MKDANILHRNICFAEQRVTERNQVTRWLLKPFARSKYLKIHVVIAPCCIFSPSGDSLLKAVGEAEGAHAALIDDAWCFIL